ncbi:glycosyltransferase [Pseudovibrio sp. SPO723]|uniref:glycosyltransferase n=1 Tax=Nesiotobacter zosterae TaxID=392721 RepID=UPI0029C25C6B|nr:glycosyltransferase [Pseudovibrio sp. SPO723]MDX5594295.1 glycosyltransferase [Pseudovibrio sp. SPO723]
MRMLEAALTQHQPVSTKRICIVTPDILGAVKNGGIGTAFFHLAVFLKRIGHSVAICLVDRMAHNPIKVRKIKQFYEKYGVEFHCVAPRPLAKTELARMTAPPYAAYEWLRLHEGAFDLVHVSEWHGLGYFVLLAKKLGIAFQNIHFVVKGSSPTLWSAEGNSQFLKSNQQLAWVFMERKSVELADTLICGSAHLLEWMQNAGYQLPAHSYFWPNVFLDDLLDLQNEKNGNERPTKTTEWVFFGRLEPRKGILLFVNALNELAKNGVTLPSITFLGGHSHRFDAKKLISENQEKWHTKVTFHNDFNALQALDYLSGDGRLAVIPALLENSPIAVYECIAARVPFIAAATGGTPELICPTDASRVLFNPDHHALAERLERHVDTLPAPAKKHERVAQSLEAWERWHGQLSLSCDRTPAQPQQQPLVSICVPHYERPDLLQQALESIASQTYAKIEVIVVDDGSSTPENLDKLRAIEDQYPHWKFLYQKNKYVGAARNAAADAASGEFLLFFDDDNVMFPSMVESLVKAALFSGLQCLTCSATRFHGNGRPMTPESTMGTQIRFLGPAKALSRKLNVVGDATCLIDAEVFKQVGGYSERFRTGKDDIEFFNRLIQGGYKVSYYPDPLYYYRVNSVSMKARNQVKEEADFRQISPFLEGLDAEEKSALLLREKPDRRRSGQQVAREDYRPGALTTSWRKLRRFVRIST